MMKEWRRETEVLTKSESLEMRKRMTQLAVWKKQHPAMTQSSSFRLLNTISNERDSNHSNSVAKKNAPAALFSFCTILAITLSSLFTGQKRLTLNFWIKHITSSTLLFGASSFQPNKNLTCVKKKRNQHSCAFSSHKGQLTNLPSNFLNRAHLFSFSEATNLS